MKFKNVFAVLIVASIVYINPVQVGEIVEPNPVEILTSIEPTIEYARESSEIAPKNVFKATAYDLSVESCGKRPSHPAYGITASGFNLAGLSREQAMTVAVDPKIIPLGTKLRLVFRGDYVRYNGVYTARDTGSAIQGMRVDVFIPDHDECDEFGVTEVEIYFEDT